ncbi:MAG: PfkB family carbohydrate kinase [Lentisphaeria bacterium]|jgi:bifunctional ADP-heptose synthase (sugar kinase/adenylyltransferase)/beta-phosphoglucomutase-like phosphatase (HAD superfamily)
MDQIDVQAILGRMANLQIGIVGDFCLDVYWGIDPRAAELSLETRLPTKPVRSQQYSLGGAGNVAANLRAMGVGRVSAHGVTGRDPFSHQMRALLAAQGICHEGLLEQVAGWDTNVYIKPIAEGVEGNRLDFGNFNGLADAVAAKLLAGLARDLPRLDAVIINQQVAAGIHHSPRFQEGLQKLILDNPGKLFFLDSRDLSHLYRQTLRKLNAYEAAKLAGFACEPQDVISEAVARAAGRRLCQQWGRPLFVTRGERGCLVVAADGETVIPGLHILEKTDPVGAGDSMLAGIAAAMAGGCAPASAAAFGNFVAGVTVQKLYQTGTASPAEILRIGADPDYIFQPEKAEDIRAARYIAGTEIEFTGDQPPAGLALAHAVFDHDGTISVLREGWEKIMEPMMAKAILGPRYNTADETTYHKVLNRVCRFIDATTGVQTLVQMQGLVKLVAEFGFVPAAEILDEHGYKAIYNQALLELVRGRLAKLQRGELAVADFVIKGAVEFLGRLHRAGVRLYLASGSDEADVVAEATALGYAHLFEGRIYGAVGDVTREAKKIVMDRILQDIGPENVQRLAAFGDGPVEIRESRRRGGLAIGIASDEVRRFGLNPAKRSRLIRAGADLVVPDFSQMDRLLSLLQMAPA